MSDLFHAIENSTNEFKQDVSKLGIQNEEFHVFIIATVNLHSSPNGKPVIKLVDDKFEFRTDVSGEDLLVRESYKRRFDKTHHKLGSKDYLDSVIHKAFHEVPEMLSDAYSGSYYDELGNYLVFVNTRAFIIDGVIVANHKDVDINHDLATE